MFNIFKKKTVTVNTVAEPKKPEGLTPSEEKAIVEEIHRLFHTAADRTRERATFTLNEKHQKAERLKALGFKNIPLIKESDDEVWKLTRANEIMEYINQYAIDYPAYKFITIEDIDEICNKYGLIFASVSFFNRDVPEKNLREIELFKLKPGHATYCNKEGEPRKYEDSKAIWKFNAGRSIWTRAQLEKLYVGQTTTYYENGDYIKVNNSYHFCAYDRATLMIAAPPSHFTVPYGYKIVGTAVVQDDPVVCQPVPGGFLVLSAWGGPEASDPIVVNQKSN